MFIRFMLAAVLLFTSCCAHGGDKRAQEIRRDISDSVFRLLGENNSGTGFVTTGGKGKKVMVTNGHVCEGNLFMTAVDKDGNQTRLRVLHESPLTDLCVLQAPLRSTPLPLADKAYKNSKVYAVGYPLGKYMIVQEGRLKGYETSSVPTDTALNRCNLLKHKIRKVKIPIRRDDGSEYDFEEKQCHLVVKSFFTTIPVDRGFSGSPMVNDDSEVVGVIMALKGNVSWGMAVPLKDLKNYLKIR